MTPENVPDLLCFWSFRPGPAGDLTAVGPNAYTLQEMNGPIGRAGEGVFGPHSLHIERGQWLRVPRSQCPALDVHGEREVTVVAWVQRRADNQWQFIAGMWDERNAMRQYGLFTSGHMQSDCRDLTRTPAVHQPHGYVSDVGGATPGCKFCFSYATGATFVKPQRWTMLAFTYDHREIRIYTDGRLDANGHCNPFAWDKPLKQSGPDGPDFTVAMRDHPKWPTYPEGDQVHDGDYVEGFGGMLGGLAVFDRALRPEEIADLHRATAQPGR